MSYRSRSDEKNVQSGEEEMAELIYYNPNPRRQNIGDCVIRAISAVTNQDWDDTYIGLVFQGFVLKDMPSSNYVWGEYLRSKGFVRRSIPDTCPACYTVDQFANDHPDGAFVLHAGAHAVAIINGSVYDNWDSRGEVPDFYFKEDK